MKANRLSVRRADRDVTLPLHSQPTESACRPCHLRQLEFRDDDLVMRQGSKHLLTVIICPCILFWLEVPRDPPHCSAAKV